MKRVLDREKTVAKLYYNDIVLAMESLVQNYINRPIALQIQKAVQKWLDSDMGCTRLENGDCVAIAWELNAICTSISHDQHLRVTCNRGTYGGNSGGDSYYYFGLGETGPHYIEIFDFSDLNIDNVRKIWIDTFAQLKDYVVLDLRNCNGGSIHTMQFVTSHFFKTGTELFTKNSHDDKEKVYSISQSSFYQTYNQIKKFNGKVYVYISGNTFSAGEIMTQILKSKNRATIYGTHTAGSPHIILSKTFGFITINLPNTVAEVDGVIMNEGNVIQPDYHVTTPEHATFIHKILMPALSESRNATSNTQ